MLEIIMIVGVLTSSLATKYFCVEKQRDFLLDVPNERSLHSTPIPRSGGIALLFSIAVTTLLIYSLVDFQKYILIYFGVFALAIISFYDDKSHIEARYRFVVHTAIAALLVFEGITMNNIRFPGIQWEMIGFIGGLFSILSIVWMINLYNFMDGMDGFAGGMALIGFSTFAIIGTFVGHETFMLANIAIVAAVAGFLVFNFPPAKIFMGDSGSSVLGLFVATFILWADAEEIFPAWVGILVFSPFIVDATVTLVRRALNKEKVWEAHRTHYYQRLVQHGWGHKKTVLYEYVLMIGCGLSAVLAVKSSVSIQWAIFFGWILMYVGLIVFLNRYLSKDLKPVESSS